MTDLEAIEQRTSRRRYTGRLNADQLRCLRDLTAQANHTEGLAASLIEDGAEAFGGITKSYGLFTGVHGLLVLAGRPSEHLFERCGHTGEWLVLEATKLGLGTCWVGGTFDRRFINTGLPRGSELVAVLTVGPVNEGKGLWERTVKRVISGKHKDAAGLMETDGEPPRWFVEGVKAAVLAPSAMNRQPVRFGWKNGVATAWIVETNGHNFVDLGIAKLHFEIAANKALLEAGTSHSETESSRGAGYKFAQGSGAAFEKDPEA